MLKLLGIYRCAFRQHGSTITAVKHYSTYDGFRTCRSGIEISVAVSIALSRQGEPRSSLHYTVCPEWPRGSPDFYPLHSGVPSIDYGELGPSGVTFAPLRHPCFKFNSKMFARFAPDGICWAPKTSLYFRDSSISMLPDHAFRTILSPTAG